MATGSPVSFWYGTRAQFDSITTKLDTTLYFITDEQALYKGTVKFSGSGVDTLLTISATEPTASSVTTGDKYFNTSDNLIHVLKNENGTVTTTATYEPANGALYYNADAQRFQTLIKDGSSYIPTEIYDAGISVEDDTGLVLNGTTVSGLNATTSSKGVVQVGSNLNVSDGVVSVPTATNARFGVVKSGDNITNNNGVLSVAKATASSLGVVKPGANINVDNNGQINVPVANGSTKGVVSAGENVNNNNGVLSVDTASTSSKGVIKVASPFSCDSNGILDIDYASTTDKGVVKVGTNIDVDDGVISVKDASTSNKGVVQLTDDLVDIRSNTKAATPALLDYIATDLDGRKQDNMSATAPVDIDNSKVSLNIGDGLAVGVAGSTNANKLIVNEASVKEVLEDVVDGGTEPAVNEIVTADNLKGALSVGQAVDVSYAPAVNSGYDKMLINNEWVDTTTQLIQAHYLETMTFKRTVAPTGNTSIGFGGNYPVFPKFASGLRYLYIADVKFADGETGNTTVDIVSKTTTGSFIQKSMLIDSSKWYRFYIASYSNVCYFQIHTGVGTKALEIKNWRQYEVTALTDEAIAYIAQLPDPDAFFRSTSAYSIRDKYLIKQDMVCPFIPTINMPNNSDLTVAAGLSYKIKYTNDNPHTITADTIPTDAYGWDTHIQMFIKGTSAINFQAPLVLMDALTPNAGHNLVVKWRNGDAFVYVDDLNAGNIVIATSGTTAGTLNYFLQQDPGSGQDNYIIFAETTDNATCDAGTVTVNYNTDILGNGTDKTSITGDISATSGKTINFQSLTIDGGTLGGAGTKNLDDVTLDGDVYIEQPRNVIFQNILIDSDCIVTTEDDSASSVIVGGTASIGGVMNVNMACNTDGFKITGNGTCRRITGNVSGEIGVKEITGITSGTQGGGYALLVWDNPAVKKEVLVEGVTIHDNYFSDTSVYEASPVATSSQKLILRNCVITGNTIGPVGGPESRRGALRAYSNGNGYALNVIIEGSSIYNNELPYGITLYGYTSVTDYGSVVLKDSYIDKIIYSETPIQYTFNNVKLDKGMNVGTVKTDIIVVSGSTVDCSDVPVGTQRLISNGGKCTCHIGNDVHFISNQGFVSVFDNIQTMTFNPMTGSIWSTRDYVIEEPIDTWRCINGTFYTRFNAANADTVLLSGTTFTSISGASPSLVYHANRIQLPASTTVSFSGNTNDADTKILDAGLIVVGDNPESPSGTATVVNASGASSTVTGIGTYIDKEGNNDFVANNTTNVVAVDDSTTGAKYLGNVLSATTGDTGANRFAKIDSGAVAVVNEATNAVNKQIITHDYEPILGGTFSLTSATVDEAMKTTTILEGGTMSIVDIRGGKESVIDLGGTNIAVPPGATASASGCTFSGGSAANGGAFYLYGAERQLNLTSCTLTGNSAGWGGGIYTYKGAVNLFDCIVSGNSSHDMTIQTDGIVTISGGMVGDTVMGGGTGSAIIEGNVSVEKIRATGSGGKVIISSGATLDLTGNANPTPIAPGGGITFEQGGATILYGDSAGIPTSSAVINNVTCATVGNNAAIVFNVANEVAIPNNRTFVLSGCSVSVTGNSNILNLCQASATYDTVTFIGTLQLGVGQGGSVLLKNCTMGANVNFYKLGSTGILNVEGTISVSGRAGYWALESEHVNIADGTHIDAHACASLRLFNVPSGSAGIVVGDNCLIKPYGASEYITLSGGTYSIINRDGTTA